MESKGLDTEVTSTTPYPASRRNRLLVIGINEYQHWTPLHFPVSDCQKLCQVLVDHYGYSEQDFIKEPLYNAQADGDTIYDELYYLRWTDENNQPRVGPSDNLIIVFSGHGHLVDGVATRQGYWIPADAPRYTHPRDLKKYISVSEVIDILANVRAHHILLIVDSCFAGAFAQMELGIVDAVYSHLPEEMPSRWVLTSGRLQTVSDKSLFSQTLIEILSQPPAPDFSIKRLGVELADKVSALTGISPLCQSLTNALQSGGEFFFHRITPQALPSGLSHAPTAAEWRDTLRANSHKQLNRLLQGRYKHLRIEHLLLTDIQLPELLTVSVKTNEQEFPLEHALNVLWQQPDRPHAVLFGEGGMGKTVSLLRLWEIVLQEENNGPIPLFIPLHEYNTATGADKEEFIWKYIARNYLNLPELTSLVRSQLWELMSTPSAGEPALLLLLDGLNEITVRKEPLLGSLDHLSTHFSGTQIILSSRFTEIAHFNWARRTQTIELQPLTQEAIRGYLQQARLTWPGDPTLQRLFTNPMMLTLYSGANSIALSYADDERFQFKKVTSYGELLWNFNEAQLAKLIETAGNLTDEAVQGIFLLRVLVPYLAYHMEEAGSYSITVRKASNAEFNFKKLLENAFRDLNTEELTEQYPELEGKRSLIGLGETTDLDAKEQRALRIKQHLVEKLRVLVMEGDELRFLHQNFRDFYAACHLRNEIQWALFQNQLPDGLSRRHLPVYLRKLLGEMEGEHLLDPQWSEAAQHFILPPSSNLLAQVLDRCRSSELRAGRLQPQAEQFVIWNIMTIWLELRGTLAGADLSRLDLRTMYFNSKSLSIHYRSQYLCPRWEESLLDGTTFLFNGHFGKINSACYSADGRFLLTASDDHMILEWQVDTGELIQTYHRHTNKVNSVQYSPDQQKILSASHDLTLIEWVRGTTDFKILPTGHGNRINFAVYSPDGSRVLSASGDGTLREWDMASQKCLHTYAGHTKSVNHVCYHSSGETFLSTSADGTLREWSVLTHACLQILTGHEQRVTWVCYSPDGLKAASASDDNTLREWDLPTGQCLRTYLGHTEAVHSVAYSDDGRKLLSASADKTVKEWSVDTGQVLKTYEGHLDRVNQALYSPDGKKILSAGEDKSVCEWSVDTGARLQTIEGQSNWVSRGRPHPDGSRFLTVNYDKSISEFSTTSGLCIHTMRGHTLWTSGARYSPDAKKILSFSKDQTLREWCTDTGSCLRIYRGHTDGVMKALYSRDGKKLFSLSYQNEYKEWDTNTGNCLLTLHGAEAGKRFDEAQTAHPMPSYEKLEVKARKEKILIEDASGKNQMTLNNKSGLLVQGCDFRRVHADSHFPDFLQESLRTYGAIFTDADQKKWQEMVAGVYGKIGS